jgi:hypothetical protein
LIAVSARRLFLKILPIRPKKHASTKRVERRKKKRGFRRPLWGASASGRSPIRGPVRIQGPHRLPQG